MRLILTGGLGFIGQNLARAWRRWRPGDEIVAVDWLADPLPEEMAPFDHVHRGPFAGPEALALCGGADAVVHLAALTGVPDSVARPVETFGTNVSATQTLLEHLRRAAPGAHLVFASTVGVGGEAEGPVCEATPPRPLSPYSASKLAAEGLISAYRGAYGLRATVLRFSNVYGPRSARQGGIVPCYCRSLLAGRPLRVNGDGRQTRDFLHVDDVSHAILSAIERRAEGLFQLGTGVETSVLELVEIFARLDPARRPGMVCAPPLSGEIRRNRADFTRARAALGFRPARALERGLAETYAWFQAGGMQ